MTELTIFTPGPCCAEESQTHNDDGESIYLNTCDCLCHDYEPLEETP